MPQNLYENEKIITVNAGCKINEKTGLYTWQEDAIEKLSGHDGIISSKTGTGKTLVALKWADIDNPKQAVILTAPTKAISNERLAQLKAIGYDVGIDTGDYKDNTDARIICCTQETYLQKYANRPNQKVIIDEFHYVFENHDRMSAYARGIAETNKTSDILLLSGTFNNPEKLCEQLNKMTDRKFELIKNKERTTDTKYHLQARNIKDVAHMKNSIVFSGTISNIRYNVYDIAEMRECAQLYCKDYDTVKGVCDSLGVIPQPGFRYGVAGYYGALDPKEKLAIEQLFKAGLIDTICSTSALSLGVNLPAENVIFDSLSVGVSGMSQEMFEQMAGRAGRVGFYDTGHIYYSASMLSNDFNSFVNNLGKYKVPVDLFAEIDPRVIVNILYDAAKDNKVVPSWTSSYDKEDWNSYCEDLDKDKVIYCAENMFEGSSDVLHECEIIGKICNSSERSARHFQSTKDLIKEKIMPLADEVADITCQWNIEYQHNVLGVLKDIYFHEFDPDKNIHFAERILGCIDGCGRLTLLANNVQSALQNQRFYNQLPEKYKDCIDLSCTNAFIDSDKTVNDYCGALNKTSQIIEKSTYVRKDEQTLDEIIKNCTEKVQKEKGAKEPQKTKKEERDDI